MPKLAVMTGLPASGKSTIARALAQETGAMWLRIDSMDGAIWTSSTAPRDLEDWTYRAAQAVAVDNLNLGRDVIGDAVNDSEAARDGWRSVAARAGADMLWLEIVCTDPAEHRRRVETRISDIPGLVLPDWEAVSARAYQPWVHGRVTIDTARLSEAESIGAALSAWRADVGDPM